MSAESHKSKHGKHVVVVVSMREDAHIPFVQKHLDEPMIVLDPREIVNGTELTYRFDRGRIVVDYGHKPLDGISGVWYRKPQPILRRELVVRDEYKLYSQNSLERHTLQLLTAFSDATWVSPYYSILRANNKGLQLAVAQQVGFNVPDTIMTSDEAAARSFLDGHGQCITKPLIIANPKVDGVQKVLLTTLIDKRTAQDLKGLHLAPSIFQEAIDIKMEVRAITVGNQVFAARVESIADTSAPSDRLENVRDNRLGHYEGRVQIDALEDIPKDITERCIEHNARLGLVFGAFDLIVDKNDTWWFLENNPNGQWAYVEEATGQLIGKAIAGLLLSNE